LFTTHIKTLWDNSLENYIWLIACWIGFYILHIKL
jgi:hypothetical protein